MGGMCGLEEDWWLGEGDWWPSERNGWLSKARLAAK